MLRMDNIMKVCLVVIFNHRYDNNLGKLRKIYKDRFYQIRFLMPFYNGNNDDVIPVYESSYQFQGYIAQAGSSLLKVDCDYYFFIADDLILNPVINENNLLSELGLEDGQILFCNARTLKNMNWNITRLYETNKLFSEKHTEFKNELMTKDEATAVFEKRGISDFTLSYKDLIKKPGKKDYIRKYGALNLLKFLRISEMPYPLVGGYSDWFVLPKQKLEIVAEKCGVTAAMGLFCEIAIPTVILLYCENVRFIDSTPYRDGSVWTVEELLEIEQQYDKDLNKLLDEFPKDKLYIHPIKLSKWKYE